MVEILVRKTTEVPWTVGSCRPVERLRLNVFSALISSGGIVAIGFISMRFVDLTSLNFILSKFGKWRKL
jgi:hypothetical protein